MNQMANWYQIGWGWAGSFAPFSFLSRSYSHRTGIIVLLELGLYTQRQTNYQQGYVQTQIELELELIQTQMTQKPVLRAEVYAHAMRTSQNS